MSWRVLADGAMIEVVQDVRDGREVTATSIVRQGQLIKGEVSKSMVERYDGNDPFVRSIIERVEISYDEETGEPVATAVGKPSPSVTVDPEAADRAASAEAEVERLKEELAKAHADAASAEAEFSEKLGAAQGPSEAPAPADGDPAGGQIQNPPLDYDSMSYEALQEAAVTENLDLPKNTSKAKLVEALKAAQGGPTP